jgi:hypothetical protein
MLDDCNIGAGPYYGNSWHYRQSLQYLSAAIDYPPSGIGEEVDLSLQEANGQKEPRTSLWRLRSIRCFDISIVNSPCIHVNISPELLACDDAPHNEMEYCL